LRDTHFVDFHHLTLEGAKRITPVLGEKIWALLSGADAERERREQAGERAPDRHAGRVPGR
jgi:hypothetical protein